MWGVTRSYGREDFKFRGLDGKCYAMSQRAFERALSVLEAHCLRREDTGELCPPYRLQVEDGKLVAE